MSEDYKGKNLSAPVGWRALRGGPENKALLSEIIKGDKNSRSKKLYVYDKDNLLLYLMNFLVIPMQSNKIFKFHKRSIYTYIDKNKSYKDK